MKFDSPLFDRIRVKPDQDRRRRATQPACEWPGCTASASHRAPKGRTQEKEYWCFCLEHVREYNHTYNFFTRPPPSMTIFQIGRWPMTPSFCSRAIASTL